MGYTIFERTTRRPSDPTVTITTLGRVTLNKSASEILAKQGAEAVVVMWDPERRKFAIRPFDRNDRRSYKLSFAHKRSGVGFSAITFLYHIGYDNSESRPLPTVWNDEQGYFEVEVPAQYLRGRTTEFPIKRHGPQRGKSVQRREETASRLYSLSTGHVS